MHHSVENAVALQQVACIRKAYDSHGPKASILGFDQQNAVLVKNTRD